MIEPYNIVGGGYCRTIKADYFKMGIANFLYHKSDGYAATGVMKIMEYEIC